VPILSIREFGTKGLNSDVSPWELPAGYITEGQNFRVTGGRLVSFGSYSTVTNLPGDLDPAFLYYVNAEAEYWVVIGTDNVYEYDGTQFTIITTPRSISGTDEHLWTGTNLGRLPIFNNPTDFPVWWGPGDAGFSDLPFDAGNTWAEKNFRCRSMRSFRNYLIAMNMSEVAGIYTDVIRWSDPADSGGLPVSWDDTDPNTRANKVVLGGNGGDIIDGLALRDSFIVYRERGISVMDYVGGDYVFRIRHLTTTQACVNTNSLVEVKGLHYFISDGDICYTDGNTVESLIHNKFRIAFRNRYNQAARETSFAVHNRYIKEIWFCVAENESTHANTAYIYNYRDDTWAQRDLPDVVYADYGQLGTSEETWDSAVGSWDTDPLRWDAGQATPFNESMLGVLAGAPGKLVKLDQADNVEDRFRTVVERTDFPIDGHDEVVSIQSIYPFISGGSKVVIQAGSQDYTGGPVRWKPPATFLPGHQRKVDIRTTGSLFAFRVESDEPGGFALVGMDVEYVPAGRR